MLPKDVRAASDWCLFEGRQGRFYELVAFVVTALEKTPPHTLDEDTRLALEELQDMVNR